MAGQANSDHVVVIEQLNYSLVVEVYQNDLNRAFDLIMTSFAEKGLSSWLIIDTLFISKLFTHFVPICIQFRLYICYLGEFEQDSDFSAFSRMTSLLKGPMG